MGSSNISFQTSSAYIRLARNSILRTACQCGSMQYIRDLLRKIHSNARPSINLSNWQRETALSLACKRQNSAEIVKLLLEYQIEDGHELAFRHACEGQDFITMELLLSHFKERMCTDDALLAACRRNHIEVVKWLLKNNGNSRAVDAKGNNLYCQQWGAVIGRLPGY